jgi:hypothetical protein
MNNYIEIEFLILREYLQIFNLLVPMLHIRIDLVELEERLYSEEFENGESITLQGHNDANTLLVLCCHNDITLQLEMARVVIKCKDDVYDNIVKVLEKGDFKYIAKTGITYIRNL